jgi:protein TonB
MFDNLIESKAKKQRRAGGFLTSFVVHTVIISGAVYATAHATEVIEKIREEKVDFVQVKKEEPPPPKEEPKPPPPPTDVVAAPPPPKGFQILTAPIKIPDVLPQIDLSRAVTNEDDFSGKGQAGGTSTGVLGGTPQPIQADQPLFDFQVEKQVQLAPGQKAPDYPPALRQSAIDGSVTVQFVVDTMGRAQMNTFKEISSTHPQFTNAVRNHLPSMRFIPAEAGGRKVMQLVQQPFVFAIGK